jgi:head-tail adaptor
MYKHRVEILQNSSASDEYNQRDNNLVHVAYIYCQKTESQGRENLYAGRICHENEVVYTTRYRSDIKAGMTLKDITNYNIIGTQNESDKWLHIVVNKTDANGSA